MYQFVRCQPNPRSPDLQGWYLVLRPEDLDTLMKLHRGVAQVYYWKFGMDPRIKPDSEEGVLKNPVRLAALWLGSVEKFLSASTTLAVNCCGGMVPLDSVNVLATVDSELMVWPELFPDEIITITRWPEGQHFYLSSNKNRLFVPHKYPKYDDAHAMAQKYTEDIRSKC